MVDRRRSANVDDGDATRHCRRLFRLPRLARHGAHPRGRPAWLSRGVDCRGLRLGRRHAPGVHRRADGAHPPGLGHHADAGAHAGHDGDDRHHARSALGRPHAARARRLRTAGGRGMARCAVRQAARTHPRVRRDPARHLGARATARARWPALPDSLQRAGRLRPRQAAQEHRARPADPDLPRRHRSQERRAVPPRSPTAGCRSSTRRIARRRPISRRSTRASAGREAARAWPTSTSRCRRPSSSPTTCRRRSAW